MAKHLTKTLHVGYFFNLSPICSKNVMAKKVKSKIGQKAFLGNIITFKITPHGGGPDSVLYGV